MIVLRNDGGNSFSVNRFANLAAEHHRAYTVENRALRAEMAELARWAIEKLSSTEREAISLCCELGLTHHDEEKYGGFPNALPQNGCIFGTVLARSNSNIWTDDKAWDALIVSAF